MATLRLMKHIVDLDKSEILYDEPMTPETIARDFVIRGGKWHVEDGWLVGEHPENFAAMIMSKAEYFGDVLVEFDAATVAPATRDINITFHGSWDEEKNIRDIAYVFGIEGWYQGYVGFEKSPDLAFVVNTKLFDFEPGRVYHVAVGNIGNVIFMAIDGVVAFEIRDPDPIDVNTHGLIGFEAFCTRVKYTNLKVKRIHAIDDFSLYTPEF